MASPRSKSTDFLGKRKWNNQCANIHSLQVHRYVWMHMWFSFPPRHHFEFEMPKKVSDVQTPVASEIKMNKWARGLKANNCGLELFCTPTGTFYWSNNMKVAAPIASTLTFKADVSLKSHWLSNMNYQHWSLSSFGSVCVWCLVKCYIYVQTQTSRTSLRTDGFNDERPL